MLSPAAKDFWSELSSLLPENSTICNKSQILSKLGKWEVQEKFRLLDECKKFQLVADGHRETPSIGKREVFIFRVTDVGPELDPQFQLQPPHPKAARTWKGARPSLFWNDLSAILPANSVLCLKDHVLSQLHGWHNRSELHNFLDQCKSCFLLGQVNKRNNSQVVGSKEQKWYFRVTPEGPKIEPWHIVLTAAPPGTHWKLHSQNSSSVINPQHQPQPQPQPQHAQQQQYNTVMPSHQHQPNSSPSSSSVVAPASSSSAPTSASSLKNPSRLYFENLKSLIPVDGLEKNSLISLMGHLHGWKGECTQHEFFQEILSTGLIRLLSDRSSGVNKVYITTTDQQQQQQQSTQQQQHHHHHHQQHQQQYPHPNHQLQHQQPQYAPSNNSYVQNIDSVADGAQRRTRSSESNMMGNYNNNVNPYASTLTTHQQQVAPPAPPPPPQAASYAGSNATTGATRSYNVYSHSL